MINALSIAHSGMSANQTQVDIISNNIANIQTPGFKRVSVNFADLVTRTGDDKNVEALTSKSLQGVSVASLKQDIAPGQLKMTGRPMDIAIQGQGFFEVETENGSSAYTRVGSLSVDDNGFLVSTFGHKLQSNISIPPDATNIIVSPNGIVSVTLGQEPQLVEIGQLELAKFTNPEGLEGTGNGLFLESEKAGDKLVGIPGELGLGSLAQGFVEQSNVNMVEEMVNLMTAQRGYQMNARVLQTAEQILETINNLSR